MIRENPAVMMYHILDSLTELKELYRYTPTFHKVERLYKYCDQLMQCEQVEFFEWFISKVLFETVDDAYTNLRVVLGG